MSELFQKTPIPGCYLFKNRLFQDARGSFSKIYSEEIFRKLNLQIPVAEVFYSESGKNVIRGMHFQTPPHDQVKVVSCLAGRILDVVLDLRKNSATYGQYFSLELTPALETTVVIPRGCAHGFYSYEDRSIVSYVVETNHNKESDQGIRWDSFGFQWPSSGPILSDRDRGFPALSEFTNPFK